jgi:diguanylate cyclase (GGDEF)-like protein/PAS domain S-box-containing protein
MEEALSKSQHLLQSLIDHMPAVVFVKDVQGQYLLANRHYAHLMRLEHGQILGRTNEEIVTYHQQHGVISSEEEALILRQLIASRREEDRAILVDKKIIDTEETSVLLGDDRICRTIKFPIYDEQGTITAIGGISIDISERKHMETALRESEEKYRVLAENIQDVVWTLDVTGQFTYVSPSVLHLRGYTPEEVMCQSLEEVLTPPSLHVVHDQMHKAPTQAVRLELEQPCKDGSTVWTECITVPLFDEADQLTGWVGVSRDIGERKQMEEALRESEDRYRSLVENINDVIFTLDMKGTITYISPIIRQLSGFEAQEVIGRPFMQFVAPDDLEALQASFQQTIMGHSHPAEFRIITKSRGLVYVRTHSRLMNQGEHVVGVTGVLTDISRWKQAESALQRANEDLKHWIREQQQRMQEITTLTEMSDLFQTCRTQEEAARVIGQLAPQLFAEMSGALYIISASRTHAEAMVSWGDIPMAQVCAPDECWALRRGHAHLAADTSIGLVCQHVPDPPPASTLCVPMMAQGETIGFFHLCRETGGFPDTARQLAVTVAEHVSLAVTNIRLRETLRYQAIRDPLTGLYNRRYMEESLERELRRAARHGMPLGVIMLDLDHFKRFNDTFGHAAGDTVLRELGLMLMSLLRGEDIACRYGGEEFMLIILDTERQAVVQRAELIRQSVSQMVIDHRGQSLGTLSLSLGVALFPQSGMSVDALVRSADRALYEAKSRGRNRVVVDKASL